MNNGWSSDGKKVIRELKTEILKKKIMLNLLVERYEWWDRTYRWAHITVATFAPLIGLYESFVSTLNWGREFTIIIGCLVAGMLKMKEYVVFDKIHDVANQQTVKYTQLFERIEKEKRKPPDRKQKEEEFIYWINREFSHIEMNDPEMSHRDKIKFQKLCEDNGIPYDEDMDAIQELLKQDKDNTPEDTPMQKRRSISLSNQTDIYESYSSTITSGETSQSNILNENTDFKINENNLYEFKNNNKDIEDCNKKLYDLEKNIQITPPMRYIPNVPSSNVEYKNKPNLLRKPSFFKNKESKDNDKMDLSISSDFDKEKYQNMIKNMDTKADMQWTMERFNTINNLD